MRPDLLSWFLKGLDYSGNEEGVTKSSAKKVKSKKVINKTKLRRQNSIDDGDENSGREFRAQIHHSVSSPARLRKQIDRKSEDLSQENINKPKSKFQKLSSKESQCDLIQPVWSSLRSVNDSGMEGRDYFTGIYRKDSGEESKTNRLNEKLSAVRNDSQMKINEEGSKPKRKISRRRKISRANMERNRVKEFF